MSKINALVSILAYQMAITLWIPCTNYGSLDYNLKKSYLIINIRNIHTIENIKFKIIP